jgi:hypothetical protein
MAKRSAKAGRRPRLRRGGAGRRKTAPARKPATRSAKAKKSRKAPARRTAARAKPKAKAKGRPAPARGKAKAKARKTAAAKARPKPAAARKTTAKQAPTPKKALPPPTPAHRRAPTLDRERRRAIEPEMVPMPPSSLDLDRSASAARSGRAELNQKLHEHTSTSPALTGGDVDADWEAAESVGDEAPGGDNPTPDQDVVDEIGRALGVEYDDDEELRGGQEIEERDRKRWELDPASSDDFKERDE